MANTSRTNLAACIVCLVCGFLLGSAVQWATGAFPAVSPSPSADCADGIDNDWDTLIDGLDPGCKEANDAFSSAQGFQSSGGSVSQGLTDDKKCSTKIENCCLDGIDNDYDTFTDMVDSDCNPRGR